MERKICKNILKIPPISPILSNFFLTFFIFFYNNYMTTRIHILAWVFIVGFLIVSVGFLGFVIGRNAGIEQAYDEIAKAGISV